MVQFFSVKNLSKYQHYKDRNPPWIKLYNSILDDYTFANLPDPSKAHLLAIMLLASRYNNKIPLDAKWVATKINATHPVDFDLLQKAGFIIKDQHCSDLLAKRYQNALPERETERETETEREKNYRSKIFETWWKEFPNKKAKKKALSIFNGILKRREATIEELTEGLARYKNCEEVKNGYVKHPTTWLNQGCWNDEPSPKQKSVLLQAVENI